MPTLKELRVLARDYGLHNRSKLKIYDLQKAIAEVWAAEFQKKYTEPVLRHKQEALLRASEIEGALDQAFPHILEILEKWTQ